ncbi:MAG: sugar phosphorylase [Chloroflexi bacterium]|nr:sugar phosphorylase [Chloroflexota bacterium]
MRLLDRNRVRLPAPSATGLDERDAILITYSDQVREPGVPPLQTLADFCARHLSGIISGIHLLPFYPSSSDDGFAVINYRAVSPTLGNWNDIARLGGRFRLMFDAVVNHVSAQSVWFQGFLRDESRYRDYFIVVQEGADLSRVVRPRALPLLTKFNTPSGAKNVWTTFSADQIDLNYRNPAVLLEIVNLLLFYVARGAGFIRLDAIAFLWKEFGTACLHLPQTHHIIQLLRAVFDQVAPHVTIITETNVPHVENIAYFGDGGNEAQMVYNFALPPLTLHAFHTGNAETLSAWASGLSLPSHQVTFFNFLASHDGVGLNPARGILSDDEIHGLVQRTLAHGGLVSHKSNPDGTTSPYELNINYFDALSDPNGGEPLDTQVDRFIAAQAIMLSLVGVPGIYFHSLFGSRGWREGVAQTGQSRAINREKCECGLLEREIDNSASQRHRVFTRYRRLLQARATHPAFHPHGTMRVLDAGASVFAVLRVASGRAEPALCLHNTSKRTVAVGISQAWTIARGLESTTDLITGQEFQVTRRIDLGPYQVLWLGNRRHKSRKAKDPGE